MNTGLLLKTNGTIQEITLDMSLHTNNISLLLQDKLTFAGQILREPTNINAVIMYGANSQKKNLPKNTCILPKPFDDITIYGDIFIISMDNNSEPQNFTIQDYNDYNLHYDTIYHKYYYD
tara:strand:- start:1371 stop:1730 length:360 start_codon:yes stop_codon:yes gene_type:complete